MKVALAIFGGIVLLTLLSIFVWTCNKATNVADNVVDNAMVNYQEFQDIYNTCSKLNTDLGNMSATADNDPMFAQFSKGQRMLAIKTNLNRWIEQYNSNSKKWNQAMWKSKALPYQLSVNDFSNYNK